MSRVTTVEHIRSGVSFGKSSGSIMEVVKKDVEPDSISANVRSSLKYAIWGKSNNHPQRLIDKAKRDVVTMGALDFKIKAHYGKGPYLYRRVISPDKKKIIIEPVLLESLDQEIQDFWYYNDVENFCQQNIINYEWLKRYYVQYVVNQPRTKILQVKNQKTKNIRVGKRNHTTGRIDFYYLSPYFGTSDEAANTVEIPAFDKLNPFSTANGICAHDVPSIDRDYYSESDIECTVSWIELAIKIPVWIVSAIDNSVNIKYHIEIPEEYFTGLFPRAQFNSEQEWVAAMKAHEEELKQKIDDCLTGVENPQKIFYTKFAVDPTTGNPLPGWKFNVLPNDLKDNAWLSAYATAAVATLSGHGVSATNTGLSLPSSLNVGSGSDTREKFNFYMQLHTVIPRQTTTEWWEIVKRANGWDPTLRLGYENVILETLDNNPTGTRTETEPTPTSTQGK